MGDANARSRSDVDDEIVFFDRDRVGLGDVRSLHDLLAGFNGDAVAPHARRRIDGTGNGFTVAAGRSFDLLLREGVVFCLLARLRLLLAPGCDPF